MRGFSRPGRTPDARTLDTTCGILRVRLLRREQRLQVRLVSRFVDIQPQPCRFWRLIPNMTRHMAHMAHPASCDRIVPQIRVDNHRWIQGSSIFRDVAGLFGALRHPIRKQSSSAISLRSICGCRAETSQNMDKPERRTQGYVSYFLRCRADIRRKDWMTAEACREDGLYGFHYWRCAFDNLPNLSNEFSQY